MRLILLFCCFITKVTPKSENIFSENASYLKVLNLNTWGLSWPWSKDREHRFIALRDEIVNGNYDIVLLQEVWLRKDYDVLRPALPYVTYYQTLNGNCFGTFLPLGCSGLTILSKHPMQDAKMYPFQFKGTFWNFDGEVFVGKGVAKARILWNGFTVDVFTTHLISYTNHPNQDNAKFRYMQALETVRHIRNSDADIKLFGGDLNTLPITDSREPYGILSTVLTDSLIDKFPRASFSPYYSTFGNKKNTYTRDFVPERIDYLISHGYKISLSDHEPIVGVFAVERTANISLSDKKHYYKKNELQQKQKQYNLHVDSSEPHSNLVRRRHFLSKY
ncbi:putative neutral sphingomyelinase isoform X2 [Lepeophtheirus salmonis]|uniref:putative neutral sphingomyelinase isoform X2 n=1 Tax=Lepeophtheirus salmonis TaxID=72036 RepID=UPI001AE7F04F|nr:putative neutral sphingomyelinase isoform X2 [Lepeophtheirus salmonis]